VLETGVAKWFDEFQFESFAAANHLSVRTQGDGETLRISIAGTTSVAFRC